MAQDDSLADLFVLMSETPANPPASRRYQLVRTDSGGLEFVEDSFDVWFAEAIAEAFGDQPPRRRVIRL
jgi:hypothetical protein